MYVRIHTYVSSIYIYIHTCTYCAAALGAVTVGVVRMPILAWSIVAAAWL